MATRWTTDQANEWYAKLPWLVGCNYTPRNAVNQLEMWQKDTFSAKVIAQELGWAAKIGFNSLRVFLHDLLWLDDAAGFRSRIDRFLGVAAKKKIGVMPVFFDSCWHPFPRLGKQRDPEPHLHNSVWVQSPGRTVLEDEKRFARLKPYVRDIVGHFRDDDRIHCWDLWNEPTNTNANSYGPRDYADKPAAVAKYLPLVYDWARSAKPTQPITTGVWSGNWGSDDTLTSLERFQLTRSDVISFHCYGDPNNLTTNIAALSRYGRPVLCTEYMSRPTGCTFAGCLPVMKQHRVAAYNWGFVAGKTQTQYPWDSWKKQYDREPKLWFHEVLRPDGKPYKAAETMVIRKLTL
jgi:hypothetical protein